MECGKRYSEKPQKMERRPRRRVVITVLAARSFPFEMKPPPVSHFLKKAANVQSGSKTPGRGSAGSVTKAQVKDIAEKKMKDLNCSTVEAAMRMVEGSARSMGLEVREQGDGTARKTHARGP